MKLESTTVTAATLLPNTRPQRWNHAIWKMRPAAPDNRNAAGNASAGSIDADDITLLHDTVREPSGLSEDLNA